MNLDPPVWLIEWATTVNLWEAILWIIGVVAVVVWIRKVGPRVVTGSKALAHGILHATELLDAMKGLPQFMERTDASLAETKTILAEHTQQISSIHHEVNFNSGKSVKDVASRTERQVNLIFARLGEVQEHVAEVRDEVSDLQAADTALRKDIENNQPTKPKETSNVDQ